MLNREDYVLHTTLSIATPHRTGSVPTIWNSSVVMVCWIAGENKIYPPATTTTTTTRVDSLHPDQLSTDIELNNELLSGKYRIHAPDLHGRETKEGGRAYKSHNYIHSPS